MCFLYKRSVTNHKCDIAVIKYRKSYPAACTECQCIAQSYRKIISASTDWFITGLEYALSHQPQRKTLAATDFQNDRFHKRGRI